MDQYLRICLCLEGVALRRQRLAQVTIVVNLTIKNDGDGAILVEQWLVAGLEVENTESRMSETNWPVTEQSRGVGTPVNQSVGHPLDGRPGDRTELAGNSTHGHWR